MEINEINSVVKDITQDIEKIKDETLKNKIRDYINDSSVIIDAINKQNQEYSKRSEELILKNNELLAQVIQQTTKPEPNENVNFDDIDPSDNIQGFIDLIKSKGI